MSVTSYYDIEFKCDLKKICQETCGDTDDNFSSLFREKTYDDYRKFWYLQFKYRLPIYVTPSIQHMWNHHMMDPSNYKYDCENYFGEVYNHDQIFLKKKNDAHHNALMEERKKFTGVIWNLEFNSPLI